MILTDISLKRPVLATVTILAFVVLGIISYISLNTDLWPDVEFPFVTVTVPYKGANPEQVESKVIQKVEEAVSSASGVKHIYSTAREGVAVTTVEFTLETPAMTAAQDIRDKIGKIRGDLPQDADEPVITRFDPTQEPIISIVLTGRQSVREMTTLVDDVIKRRLETISGVASVDEQGAQKREIDINLQRDKVAAYGLSVAEIADNLKGENMEVPGGKLTQSDRDVNVRTMGNIETPQGFLTVPAGRHNGVQLYVRDIATVRDTVEEPTGVTKFYDAKEAAGLQGVGRPSIGLDIMKQSGANTVKTAAEIKQTVESLNKELPPGTELVIVRDTSNKIKDSLRDVLFNLVTGGLLAVVIVYIFLGSWRSTLISAIAIPASIIATFFTMKVLNFTLNTMSLMALSLVVGILIDDAIVVIENIVRHMAMGKERFRAAAEATREIGLAVTATTLTLVAVFVPVGMMTGIVGQFFKQFGITVAFAVLVSLFIAFTLTPMLAANFLDVSHGYGNGFIGRCLSRWNAGFDRLTVHGSALLRWALNRRLIVIGLAVVFFVISLGVAGLLGSSFIPNSDVGQFIVKVDYDPGMSLAGAGQLADRLNRIMASKPEVMQVYYTAKDDATLTYFVNLQPKKQRKRGIDSIVHELRQEVAGVPGIQASFINSGVAVGEDKPVQIRVKGPDLDKLDDIAEQAETAMLRVKGAVDVTSSHKPGKPDVQLAVNRDRAADLGVSTGNIADTLRTMFTGVVVSQFKDGDDRYDVRLRLTPDNRTAIRDLNGIYLTGRYQDAQKQAILVPLSQVTDMVYSTSPSTLRREDRQRVIQLTASLEGTSLGEYTKALTAEMHKIKLPPGYSFVSSGASENMNDTFTAMGMAILLGVSFIFFILAAQFESYIDPFSIMLSLPLAIIGAIFGLLVMRSELSMISMIGVIMLLGLVTKNAILLIDFAKQRMNEGMECKAALVEAAQIRMRPIMMTTAAMIIGMLPLALGLGPGSEGRAPMAHAIIGGLLTSTLLTLIVVPVVYSLLNDLRSKLLHKRTVCEK